MYHTMFCYGLWLSESYSVKVYHFNYNSISNYSVTELNFDNAQSTSKFIYGKRQVVRSKVKV